ncbi:hypothetical protein [Salinibacterium sp. ZJ450]|uniref:hypothetical protein n=1 Tax=Salinibacterium sp. ZJ450 TaxID=2708338 RepID=UPI001423D5C2|nr:hypothetical protein [Salinibacterium sp. ZJ450]
MRLRPAQLLTGPRGRRLCLEFALRRWDNKSVAADEIRQAVFYAAYDADPGRGASVVLFGAGADQRPLPHPSPEDVGQLLESVPLAEPDERALWFSLAAAVDSARYWQEPDGEDILASTPEVGASLGRVAAAITESPCATRWVESMDRLRQWTVTFAGTTGGSSSTARTARETLDRWRSLMLVEESNASRERPADPSAMVSGPWWSIPPSVLTRTTRSLRGRGPVGLWLVEDRFDWTAATTEQVPIPADARIYEIDGPQAWVDLCRRYPLDVTASRRHDWYRTTGRNGRWLVPDWSRVQHDHDAVHLSVGGYLATAGLALPVADDWATVLAGWDPDQTYWLRDVTPDTSTHQEWKYDGEDGNWTPSNSR